MKKVKKGHPKNNFTDMQSIGLVQNILGSHGKVMPDLKVIDKWPLIDGKVEVQDDSSSVIGRISVQAKTLPKDHNLKFPCPIDFFVGCRIEPSLLLGIDNENNKIYWHYFDFDNIKDVDFENNKASKTISFNAKQCIDRKNTEYIDEWRLIVKTNVKKYQEYNKLKNAYALLQKKENLAIGKTDLKYVQVHKFLDRINWLLDNHFKVVKDTYYPGSWKIGIALYKYTETELSYTLYPVLLNNNDVQIKEVDQNLHELIEKKGLGFSATFHDNPIHDAPESYANKIVFEKLKKLIDTQSLKDSKSEFLISEYVFYFIDRFHLQLGMDAQPDQINVASIDYALNTYLPLWIEESLKFLISIDRNQIKERINTGRMRVINPDSLICEIMPDERKVIINSVAKRINEKSYSQSNFLICSNNFSFKRFKEFIDYLKLNKITSVKRVYAKRNWERMEKLKSNYVFNALSPEDINSNIKIFFENIEMVFNDLILENFPALGDKIQFWYGADKILIHLELKDSYSGMEHPGIEYYFLKRIGKSSGSSTKIEFIDDSEVFKDLREKMTDKDFDGFFTFNDEKYEFNSHISSRSAGLDFMYQENPMLNYIYEYLMDVLTEEFINELN